RARQRARTRTYPTDRAGWCARVLSAVSPARASGRGIEPRRLGERADERAPLGLDLAHAPHHEIAGLVDVAARAALRHKPCEIVSCDLAETVLLPGVDRDHEMAGEALDQRTVAEIVEALVRERRRERTHARLLVAHRHGADHGAEYEPGRRRVLGGALRPA